MRLSLYVAAISAIAANNYGVKAIRLDAVPDPNEESVPYQDQVLAQEDLEFAQIEATKGSKSKADADEDDKAIVKAEATAEAMQ